MIVLKQQVEKRLDQWSEFSDACKMPSQLCKSMSKFDNDTPHGHTCTFENNITWNLITEEASSY